MPFFQMLLFLEELEPAKLKNPNDTKETILKDAFVKYDPSIDVSTVRGLSFTVKPSELLAIIGPIGSGKVSSIYSRYVYSVYTVYIRLGQKGVNFGNSLTAAGVCCMGSKDEDVIEYFGKKMSLPMPNLI